MRKWMVLCAGLLLWQSSAIAQDNCRTIDFANGTKAELSGSLGAEESACYLLPTQAGQQVNVDIVIGKNTVFSVDGLAEAQEHYSFKAQQDSYKIVVAPLFPRPETYQVAVERTPNLAQSTPAPAPEPARVNQPLDPDRNSPLRKIQDIYNLLLSGKLNDATDPATLSNMRLSQSYFTPGFIRLLGKNNRCWQRGGDTVQFWVTGGDSNITDLVINYTGNESSRPVIQVTFKSAGNEQEWFYDFLYQRGRWLMEDIQDNDGSLTEKMKAPCAGASVVSASAAQKAERWTASSKTAISITGNITIDNNTLIFGNGKRLKLTPVRGVVSNWDTTRNSFGSIYKLDPPTDPVLLRGNTLCGTPVTYIVLARRSNDSLTLTTFFGPKEPTSVGDGMCAMYFYER